MELLIPSFVAFIILLLAGALAFFVIPRFAPLILVSGSGVVLALALYVHWARFGVNEYERATWQNNLKTYGPYILLAAVLLLAYGFYALNQGPSSIVPTSIAEVVGTAPLPSIEAPVVGGGYQSVMRTATSRIRDLIRKGRISTD
jgi:hypothetical protein